ncbi:hypothetical protein JQ633_30730 [Bradyrhizobium tropiciagri]|uniref:hypothetical protein n=1 Tax=Bradyrhizobium tropiciagri TaxID=312253 RepID=UPI001BA44A66|nr:hypothetical protein [Bradyrhizobium tropiciagri]MBR0874767.1 hypothetical protein [Bradyrhizobium tropiciagri]
MRVRSIVAVLFAMVIGLLAFADAARADEFCEANFPPCPDGAAPFWGSNGCTCPKPKSCAPQNWFCSWQPIAGGWTGCTCEIRKPPPPPKGCSAFTCSDGSTPHEDGFGGCSCEQQILKPFVTLVPRRASPVPRRREQ